MPKVVVKKSSSLDANEVFSKVTDILENDEQLKKLDSSYACQFDQSTLSGTASGKLFKATLEIQNNNPGSEVSIEVSLPMTLALAKGVVKSTLEKKLDQVLGA